MRTAIFLVGILIAGAINHQASPPDLVTKFTAIMFCIFACMDLVDFFNNLTKK